MSRNVSICQEMFTIVSKCLNLSRNVSILPQFGLNMAIIASFWPKYGHYCLKYGHYCLILSQIWPLLPHFISNMANMAQMCLKYGQYGLNTANTGQYGLNTANTGQYRPIQASTGQYWSIQANTGQYRPVHTIPVPMTIPGTIPPYPWPPYPHTSWPPTHHAPPPATRVPVLSGPSSASEAFTRLHLDWRREAI